MTFNKVFLSGNLVADAETKDKSGFAITNFRIAVNERRKGASGNWEDVPNFFNCTMFGNYGAKLASSMTKGTRISIGGKLRQSTWEKDGQKHNSVTIIVEEVEMPRKSEPASELYDDDLPF